MEISIAYPLEMNKHVLTQSFGEHPEIYRQFIVKGIPLQGHNGHDFASPGGSSHDVFAAAPGKVSRVAYDSGGYGLHIYLQCEGFKTLYAHLSLCRVKPGQCLDAGDVLGLTGSSGFSTGVHLHFGLYPDGEPAFNGYGGAVDPSPLYGNVVDFEPSTKLEYSISPGGTSLFVVHTLKQKIKGHRK